MNLFSKMKKNLKLVLVSNFLFWLIINIIGAILSFLVWEWSFIITLLSSILIFALVLKLYSPHFSRTRERVMRQVFNKTNHDSLEFKYYKEEDYEAFEALDIEGLAQNFDISSCIFGNYKDLTVESFQALYTKSGKRKDLVNLRIYIFSTNKKIDIPYNNHSIKHELFDKADMGKYVSVQNNKLYIAYGYQNTNLRYSFEPMSHSKYETFLERYNKEIDFIDYINTLLNGNK